MMDEQPKTINIPTDVEDGGVDDDVSKRESRKWYSTTGMQVVRNISR